MTNMDMAASIWPLFCPGAWELADGHFLFGAHGSDGYNKNDDEYNIYRGHGGMRLSFENTKQLSIRRAMKQNLAHHRMVA